MDFTAALHTYIEVEDISLAKVDGLQNHRYLDKVTAFPVACWLKYSLAFFFHNMEIYTFSQARRHQQSDFARLN